MISCLYYTYMWLVCTPEILPTYYASIMLMVILLYFLPMLSSLSTGMPKQLTSWQHSMQGGNNGINIHAVSLALIIISIQ